MVSFSTGRDPVTRGSHFDGKTRVTLCLQRAGMVFSTTRRGLELKETAGSGTKERATTRGASLESPHAREAPDPSEYVVLLDLRQLFYARGIPVLRRSTRNEGPPEQPRQQARPGRECDRITQPGASKVDRENRGGPETAEGGRDVRSANSSCS
jgi:hypothetical protein